MHKKNLQCFIALGCVFLLLAGCSYPANLLDIYNNKSPSPSAFTFKDGGKAQYFYLKKSLSSSLRSSNDPVTHVFVVGGADCTSFAHFLPQYFRGLEGESGDMHIYMLQKRFIGPRTWGRNFGCSRKFLRADHPEQWIADQVEFIGYQLSLLDERPNRRIVLLGISEGGEVAPILAQRLPQTTHLVILANGGLAPLDAFALQRAKKGLAAPEALRDLLAKPDQDANENAELILGRTATYWLQINKIKQIENLLLLNIPILMTMGVDDQVVPIESAWYAKKTFENQSNKNLTVITYPGANHALVSESVNFLPDFFHKMDLWLSAQH